MNILIKEMDANGSKLLVYYKTSDGIVESARIMSIETKNEVLHSLNIIGLTYNVRLMAYTEYINQK
tara:strand:+ start:2238 stop:2435 length:198 start_codon:yes stop_codon:yes gene_type:complete